MAKGNCIAFSESSSFGEAARRYERKLRLRSVVASRIHKSVVTRRSDLNCKRKKFKFGKSRNVAVASCQSAWATSKAFGNWSALWKIKPKVGKTCRADLGWSPASSYKRQQTAANSVTSNTSGLEAYLERQGRNKFINFAQQKALAPITAPILPLYFMGTK